MEVEERLDKMEDKLLTLVKLDNKAADLALEQGMRLRVLETTVERLTGERRD